MATASRATAGVSAAGAVTVTVLDDDEGSGETVADVSPVSVRVHEAGAAVWEVKLKAAPPGPVTVTPINGDTGAVRVSPALLRFTSENWRVAQRVTVTGVADRDDDDETVTVSHAVDGLSGRRRGGRRDGDRGGQRGCGG